MSKEVMKDKGEVKATYDMWQLEYERLNDILRACSDYMLVVRSNSSVLLDLFNCLVELYRIVRPLLTEKQRKDMDKIKQVNKDKVFGELERRGKFGRRYVLDLSVVDCLDDWYDELMRIRQFKGLGIRIKTEKSEASRIKRAAGGF